jgi:hypothetical protein
MSEEILAISCADLHICQRPPIARSEEPDWQEAMKRPLLELAKLKQEHDCHLLIAGDVFDRYNTPAETINWTIKNLPEAYSICGNHEMPNHSYKDLKRSAYWTLVEAGVLHHLRPGKPIEVPAKGGRVLRLHAFPFGFPITPLKNRSHAVMEIAVVHSYLWTVGTNHKDASEDQNLQNCLEKFKGYDVLLFGDNHIHFSQRLRSGATIWNNGSLMRRRSDQDKHEPSVGLIHPDNSISRYKLDCSKDILIKKEELMPESSPGMDDFIEELGSLSDVVLDFREAMERALVGVPQRVREIVIRNMDK